MSERITQELPRQNITVVGAFNPAVIQPSWVRRNVTAITEEIRTLIPVEEGSPSFQGSPVFQASGLLWVVTTDRLVVYGPTRLAGAVVATILTTLSHTPLQAAGVNFLFTGRAAHERCGPWRLLAPSAEVGGFLQGAPRDLSLGHVAQRTDGVRLSVKVTWPSQEPEAVLELNYHLEGHGEDRAKELADHAGRAAEFESDADRIRKGIFGE